MENRLLRMCTRSNISRESVSARRCVVPAAVWPAEHDLA